MKTRLPTGLIIVAVLQFIPPLLLPPATLAGLSPVIWLIVALVFVALGVNLLRRQAWSRLATIFVQGFNIIIRLLVVISHAVQEGQPGGPVDVGLVTTAIVSIALSSVILYYVDLPEVQVTMQ